MGHSLQVEREKIVASLTELFTSQSLRPERRNVCVRCGTGDSKRVTAGQLLSGWKEIANYMHQGVRTVQRWEAMGLPVRRVKKTRRAPVIAFADDLDAWARSLHVPLLDTIEELRATISSLEGQIRSLKRQLRMRNRPAHMDKTPTSHAITQLSRNFGSGSPPIGEDHERIREKGLA